MYMHRVRCEHVHALAFVVVLGAIATTITVGVEITVGYFENNRIEPLLRSLGLELIRIG
jgi:hypothetical protein